MIAMDIRAIARAIDGRVVPDSAGQTVIAENATTDSREVLPGFVFVAKPGEMTDGHLFAPQAAAAGAALIIVDHELDLDVPQIVVEDTVVALGAFAAEVLRRARAGQRLSVVGITGSNGKTTTKNLLATILARSGPTVAPRGSYNNEVGAPTTILTITPETRYLVVEMGAGERGDIRRLIEMTRPDIGVVLTVGLAHAETFRSIEDTQAAKAEMVADLGLEDVAVLNADDPRVAAMADATRARVLRFGRSAEAEVRAEDVDSGRNGTTFTLRLPAGRSARIAFRVLGEHHVVNALAAAAVADQLGVGIDDIVAGLESVTRAEHARMEVLGNDRVTIVNDAYNASPDSMAAALRTLAQITRADGRSIAVLGEMTELGALSGDEHDAIGLQAVRLGIDLVVVVGRGARRLHLATIAQGSWDGESRFVESADEAYDFLTGHLTEGDTVLVKASNASGLWRLGDRLGEFFS